MIEIIKGDFRQIMKELPLPDSVDLILTDPPYGHNYLYLWEPLGESSKRLLARRGSLISITGNVGFPLILNALSKNLHYYWCCCLLHKEVGLIKSVGLYNTWKPVVWFTKEPNCSNLSMPIPDGISPFGAQKNEHRWQQSENWVRHFIEALVPRGGLVLDPFIGTGTTAKICKELGRDCIGIDIDPLQVERAKRYE